MSVYRRQAEECCSECGRVMIIATYCPGTPGVYCSPTCLDAGSVRFKNKPIADTRSSDTKSVGRGSK